MPAFAHANYNLFMHIGIDCRLPTYQMGGISQYAIHLVQALGTMEGDNRFTIFHSRRERRSFVPSGNTNFSRSNLLTPCHHRYERLALAIELARHNLNVFHSTDFIPPAKGTYRRVITIHDLNFLYYPQFLTPESRRYYARQIEWAVSSANHIIADSDATRRDLMTLLGVQPHRVTTVHLAANPVHSTIYSKAQIAQTASDLGLNPGFILWVGTLEPRKNLPTLLRAYHRLRNEAGFTIPLVLVGGKGWLYEEIFRTIDELQLSNNIFHLSGITDTQLAHLYRLAGVLAMPSHYEGFGLPVLEAMHGGCPCVVSNRGSLPEVAGDAAILIDPDGDEDWFHALNRILVDTEFASSLSQAGLLQARKFTWQKTAAATLDVYLSERNH